MPTGNDGRGRRARTLIAGLASMAAGWAVLWSVDSVWNPLAFTALWTGAAVVMWGASRSGYPGMRRHAALATVSAPLWWWFELINARVQNWEYILSFDYSPGAYAALTSIAFATVVPALTAATALVRGLVAAERGASGAQRPSAAKWLMLAGIGLQIAAVAFPVQLFPLTWVAPFLIVDGLVVAGGGRSLVLDLGAGHWREAAIIAAGGLICGALWEFWNYWSSPRWVYDIPLLGFGKVFEMPVLGYLGYVPFAWSVTQLVRALELLVGRWWRTAPT